MEERKFDELEQRASAMPAELDHIRIMEARSRVHREIEAMKQEGKAFELSSEEEDLLRAFRRFKLRMRKNGEVFKWQTNLLQGVQIVENTAEIVHPSEVEG